MSSLTSSEEAKRARQLIEACAVAASGNGPEAQAALAWLQAFAASPRPYGVCLQALTEAPANAAFQALVTVREALVREASLLERSQIDSLQRSIEQFVVGRALSLPSFVARQAMHVLAVLQKRFWFSSEEDSSAAALLAQTTALLGTNAALGLLLCEAFIAQFSSSSRSGALGLRWETHVRCHRSFERLVLLPMFVAVCSWIGGITERKALEDGTLTKALVVLHAILSWEFDEQVSSRKLALRAIRRPDHVEAGSEIIKPGAAWTEVLVANDNVSSLLLSLYRHVRQRPEARLIRQALVQLCSLRGRVFPLDESIKTRFLDRLSSVVLELASTALNDTDNDNNHQTCVGEELLDVVLLIQRLVSNFGLPSLVQSGRCTDLVRALAALTLKALPQAHAESLDTTMAEALDMALDCWSTLLSQRLPDVLFEEVAKHAENVFTNFVHDRLQRAVLDIDSGAIYDEDDVQFCDSSYADDQISSIALLARPCVARSLPLLANEINARCNALGRMADAFVYAPPDPKQLVLLQEQLHILVLVLGRALADQFSPGEVNEPPALLQQERAQLGVRAATDALLALVALENRMLCSQAKDLLSPFVGASVSEALARWVASYLKNESDDAVRVVVEHAYLCLFEWSDEWKVAANACRLIAAVTRSAELRTRLASLPAWSQLIAACCSSDLPILRLNLSGDVLFSLTAALCKSSIGSTTPRSAFEHITTPIVARFKALLAAGAFRNGGNVERGAELLSVLDMLRGVVSTSGRLAVDGVCELMQTLFGDLVALIRASVDSAPLLTSVLRVLSEMAGSSVVFMNEQQAHVFFRACLQAVQAYGDVHHARLGAFQRGTPQAGDDDSLDDLAELFSLLEHISSKDLFDFGPDPVAFSCDAALAGVVLLLPHLSLSALQYPSICVAFYSLLNELVRTYPDKFAQLDPPTQAALLQAVEFSFESAQADITRSGLEVLKALAEFVCETKQTPTLADGLLPFQRKVLHTLLFAQMDMSLLDPLADALQPLVAANESAFTELVQQFVAEQQNDEVKRRLTSAFQDLLSGRGERQAGGAQNRFRFRELTHVFVEDLRAYLQTT